MLKQPPSLKTYFQGVLDKVYQSALAEALTAYPTSDFPITKPFSTELPALLTEEFWH
ncbi:MAG: hypothetical protein DCF32_15835 [Leptolyngbya sp.]|nr:MAG: hypothetical protein DCF32_15835 [Leptolyngbya sp.]